jgi:hypothetical protein
VPEATLPLQHVFYDDLDTVRFADSVPAEEKPARSVTALATVMTGLLIGEVAPVLSRAQVSDCEPLLALTAPAGDRAQRDDRLAFLKLVRRGYIEVTLPEGGPSADAPDGQRYTVLNGFRSWVADPGFVFSGWPELNGNPELRQEILGALARPDGRLDVGLPDHLAARIEGLRDLDHALSRSPAGIRVVRTAARPLSGRVAAAAREVADGGDAVRAVVAVITERAQRETVNLDSRSGWYLMIDRESAERPDHGVALDTLRDIVDFSYNAMVGESLTGSGVSLSIGDAVAAAAAAAEFTPGRPPGERWADLMPAAGRGEWLRWADIPDLLTDLEGLASAESRLRELRVRQAEWIGEYDADHSWGINARIALPAAVGGLGVSFASSVLTGTPVEQAAAASALAGVVTIAAATPAVRAFTQRREARLKNRRMSTDDRGAVRTGAAAWLDRLKRPR